MRKTVTFLLFVLLLFPLPGLSQEKESPFTAGVDLASSFVWRGSKIGKGPAVQPLIEFSYGGWTLGAWGNYCISDEEAVETDLYASFNFDPGFKIGVTNYFFPGTSLFDIDNNAIELNGGFSSGTISLSAFYILNEGAGSAGGDLYFEAAASAGSVNLFAGAGSGWHTLSGKFNICNLGLSATKEIRITEGFALPLTGSAILNPDSEQIFVVVKITL